MTDLFAQVAGTVLAGMVIWKGEPALAKMRKETPILLRFSLWLLVVGSFARLIWISLGNVPDPVTLLMLGGVSVLLLCERRVSVLTRGRRINKGDFNG